MKRALFLAACGGLLVAFGPIQAEAAAKEAGRDALEDCGLPAGGRARVSDVNQAARALQACLRRVYPAGGAYSLKARVARFGVATCSQPVAAACRGLVEVEGVVIDASGSVPAGDPLLRELARSLSVRQGIVLGFHVVLQDETNPALPPGGRSARERRAQEARSATALAHARRLAVALGTTAGRLLPQLPLERGGGVVRAK